MKFDANVLTPLVFKIGALMTVAPEPNNVNVRPTELFSES